MSATEKRSGRSASGNLRNYKQMTPGKLRTLFGVVKKENNDPEVLSAMEQEMKNRGFIPKESPISPHEIAHLEELHKTVHRMLLKLYNDHKMTASPSSMDSWQWFARRNWRYLD